MVSLSDVIDKIKELFPNFRFSVYSCCGFITHLHDDEGYFRVGIDEDEKGVFLTTKEAEFPVSNSLAYINELVKKYSVEAIGCYYGIRIESLDEEEIKVKVGKMLNFMTTCLLRNRVYNPEYIELYDIDEDEKCSTPFSEVKKKVSLCVQAKTGEFDEEDEVIPTYLYSHEGKPLELRVVKLNGGYNLQASLNYEKVRELKLLPSIQTLCGVSTNDKERVMEMRVLDDDLLSSTIADILVYLSLASNVEIFK